MNVFEQQDKIVKDFFDKTNEIILHKNKAIANVIYKGDKVAVRPDYKLIDDNFKWLHTNRAKTYNYYKRQEQQKALILQALQWELM